MIESPFSFDGGELLSFLYLVYQFPTLSVFFNSQERLFFMNSEAALRMASSVSLPNFREVSALIKAINPWSPGKS